MSYLPNRRVKFKVLLPICGVFVILLTGGFMAKWKIVSYLPSMHKPKALWFKGNIGLVFGYYSSLDDWLSKDILRVSAKKQAIVLRSEDTGKNWQKVYGGEGEINRVSYQKDKQSLYVLGRKYFERGDWKSYLLCSYDLGIHWLDLKLPANNIIGIDFSNKIVGYAWSNGVLFKTLDAAKSWREIEYPIRVTVGGPQPVVDGNGTLWVVYEDKAARIENENKYIEFPFQEFLRVDCTVVADDNSFWLVGRDDKGREKRTKVLKLNGTGYIEVADLEYFLPRAFYVGKKKILILGSDMNETPPRKILVYSENLGKTWKREEPKISDAMGPVFFENENIIWAYGSADRIQRRKF